MLFLSCFYSWYTCYFRDADYNINQLHFEFYPCNYVLVMDTYPLSYSVDLLVINLRFWFTCSIRFASIQLIWKKLLDIRGITINCDHNLICNWSFRDRYKLSQCCSNSSFAVYPWNCHSLSKNNNFYIDWYAHVRDHTINWKIARIGFWYCLETQRIRLIRCRFDGNWGCQMSGNKTFKPLITKVTF